MANVAQPSPAARLDRQSPRATGLLAASESVAEVSTPSARVKKHPRPPNSNTKRTSPCDHRPRPHTAPSQCLTSDVRPLTSPSCPHPRATPPGLKRAPLFTPTGTTHARKTPKYPPPKPATKESIRPRKSQPASDVSLIQLAKRKQKNIAWLWHNRLPPWQGLPPRRRSRLRKILPLARPRPSHLPRARRPREPALAKPAGVLLLCRRRRRR